MQMASYSGLNLTFMSKTLKTFEQSSYMYMLQVIFDFRLNCFNLGRLSNSLVS